MTSDEGKLSAKGLWETISSNITLFFNVITNYSNIITVGYCSTVNHKLQWNRSFLEENMLSYHCTYLCATLLPVCTGSYIPKRENFCENGPLRMCESSYTRYMQPSLVPRGIFVVLNETFHYCKPEEITVCLTKIQCLTGSSYSFNGKHVALSWFSSSALAFHSVYFITHFQKLN